MNTPHIPVLYKEINELFKDISGTIVDCTVGYGGHSEILLQSNPNIKLICNDRDDEALEYSRKRLEPYTNRVTFIKGRFSNILEVIDEIGDIRGVLADIGVSSLQLDKNERGFGFNSLTLDMRMDTLNPLSAKEVVNNYSLSELEKIFKEYGEIREYKKIASKIIERRRNQKFESARDLSDFISSFSYQGKINPSTLAFQAIRIEVNSELDEIKNLCKSIEQSKLQDTLIAIISFHSLEDRIVKQNFKNWAKKCICSNDVYRCECGNNNSLGKILTKKPILPTASEIKNNIRSRSSKLRAFYKDNSRRS